MNPLLILLFAACANSTPDYYIHTRAGATADIFYVCSTETSDTLTATLDPLTHLTVIQGYKGTCPILPFVGKEGNYHCLVIPLFYRSLKQNITLRCAAK